MKDTLEAQKALESLANKKGYKVYGTPYGGNNVNHNQKIITMNAVVNDERNIKMSHELGHIAVFKVWKWIVVIDELMAWIAGYCICKRHKINTQDFWKIARKCLKTYTDIRS